MYKNISLSRFLDLVAAPTAVPGGGSVAALSGALGAALGKMIVGTTCRKHQGNRYRSKIFSVCLRRFDKNYRILLTLTYRDAQAYEMVRRNLKTKRLPTALRGATMVPYQVMHRAVDNLLMINQLVNLISPKISSDLGVATILCKVSLEGADFNVRINLRGMMNRHWARQIENARKVLLKKGIILHNIIIKQLAKNL